MPVAIDQYILFASIVTLIVVTPGPNLFLLLGSTPGSGRQSGFCMTAGFCAAIISHAALALVGVGAIIATSALLFTVLKTAGAAYLVWMGMKALLSLRDARMPGRHRADDPAPRLSMCGAFTRGYLTNLLNPKPAIFYVAAFPQFLSGTEHALFASGMVLALTHALIALVFYGSVVMLIGKATRFLNRSLVARTVKSASGIALILLGGRLLLARNPA